MDATYSTREIATALGCNISTVHRRALSEGWPVFGQKKARGGGKVYALTSLPQDVREAIAAGMLHAEGESLPAPASPAPASTATATKRQRECMEARLVFVREVERLAAVSGKESAIRRLVEDARREALPAHLQCLVTVACARPGASGRRGLSRRRLYEWCSRFAKGGISALIPGQRQKDMTPPAWAPAFLALYQTPQKPSVEDCLRRLKVPGPLPSRDAVYRFLKKMGMPAREHGRATGNAMLSLRPHKRRSAEELLPGDVYTADGTTFDAEIQHPGTGRPFKPEITMMLDVATRRCVGVSAGLAESALTVLDALRMACFFAGIPAMLYTDNGPGYRNKLLGMRGLGMLARLGVEMTNSIPGRPQGKGLMERAVQTLCVPLAKRLPTCTHKDMDRDAGKQVFKITREDIKRCGASPLLPTWWNFLHQLGARVDEYNNTPHRALPMLTDRAGRRRHMSPNERWERFIDEGWEPFTVLESDREDMFMPGEVRVIRNGWIRLFGRRYFAKELEEFHGDLAEIRYDIWDSSKVFVWTTDGQKICEAKLEGNTIPYFAPSRIEDARERRIQGQVKRLAGKLDAIAPGATVQLPPAGETIVVDCFASAPASAPAQAVETPAAEPRPIFQHAYEKYSWLMGHRDRQTDGDRAWLLEYVAGDDYAELHDYYLPHGLAWPGYQPKPSNLEN